MGDGLVLKRTSRILSVTVPGALLLAPTTKFRRTRRGGLQRARHPLGSHRGGAGLLHASRVCDGRGGPRARQERGQCSDEEPPRFLLRGYRGFSFSATRSCSAATARLSARVDGSSPALNRRRMAFPWRRFGCFKPYSRVPRRRSSRARWRSGCDSPLTWCTRSSSPRLSTRSSAIGFGGVAGSHS